MISELANQSASMEEIFIFTTAISTLESFIKSLASLKVQLKTMKTINGQQLRIQNGFQRKMLWWKSIYRRNWVEEKLILKNNSSKTIEKCLNFMLYAIMKNISFITSLQMILLKSDKFQFQILEKIHSLLLSVVKNCHSSLLSINLDKLMLKNSWHLSNCMLDKNWMFLEESIF